MAKTATKVEKTTKKDTGLVMPSGQFKQLVNLAAKGASNNKLLAITSMMEIDVTENVLTLTTTDRTNFFKVSVPFVDAKDFNVVVPLEQFAKLVNRITAAEITLTFDAETLTVKGGGTYHIALPIEEDELIRFPKFQFKEQKSSKDSVILGTLQKVISVSKASLGVLLDEENKNLTGIYFGDGQTIASDSFKAAVMTIPTFKQPFLMAPEILDLVMSMDVGNADATKAKVEIERNEDKMILTCVAPAEKESETKVFTIQTVELPGREDYPVEQIVEFAKSDMPNKSQFAKDGFVNALSRLDLFVEEDDDNSIDLVFTKSDVTLMSKKSTANETIKASTKSSDETSFTASFELKMLRDQIESQLDKTLTIHYGSPTAIRIEDKANNLDLVVAAKED